MVVAAIRPEKMRLVAPGETAANRAAAQVLDFSYLGTSIHLVAAVPGLGDLTLTLPARRLDAAPELGSAVTLGWDPDGSTLVENDMHPAAAEAA
jgi:putative spermidine/putrescine transport system ATP-binding protein